MKPKKRLKSIAKMTDDCATLLQKLVRVKAADSDGICSCVTCGKRAHWKEMQGGHFIERGRLATKLVEENIHPQCPGCNCFRMKMSSCVLDYRRYMVEVYGEEGVTDLEDLSRTTKKHTRSDLVEMKIDLSKRLKELGC